MLMAFFVVLNVNLLCSSIPAVNSLESTQLGEVNQKLTFQLLKSLQDKIAGHKNDIPITNQTNVIFSPFNIGRSLTLLLLAVGGQTFTELFNTLHYGDILQGSSGMTAKNQEILHSVVQKVTQTLKSYQNVTIEISNGLYPSEKFKVDPIFVQKLSKYYETRVQTLNYESQADAAIVKINSDVSEFSKGLIKDLLPPGSLSSGTKVVLVDTIHFNGDWKISFEPELTSVKAFTRDDGKREEVKMMFGTNKAQYGETQLKKIEGKPSSTPDQKIKILGIQYANPNLAMFFVLPEQKGLPNLIKVLSFESLTSLIKTAKKTLVDITLPIFKTSFDVTLPETLKKLGLRNIFEGTADFSGLTGYNNSFGLCISEIFHKAVIEVNEKGTKAAASTGVVIGDKSSLPSTESFTADRPFLYFVQDLLSGHILFIGTYIKVQ
ncbi:unnamed protein product [Gordionus sp. m RMFG-2023]|uniref:serpin B4-like n=1 Tax=Gordionus sp. m RMFG-2023 TaxID=3053472 RepID=UPI0030DF8507